MNRIAALLEFLMDDPGDSFTRFALASEYLKAGRLEDAVAGFEGLVRDDPGYVGTYYHLGKLYQELSRLEEAIAIYKQGISVARAAGDLHSKSELQSALLEAEDPDFQ